MSPEPPVKAELSRDCNVMGGGTKVVSPRPDATRQDLPPVPSDVPVVEEHTEPVTQGWSTVRRKRHGARQPLENVDIVSIQAEEQPRLSEHVACAAVVSSRNNEDALTNVERHTCLVDTVARSNIVATDVVFVPSSVSSLALTRHPSELNRLRKPDSKAKRIPKSTRRTEARSKVNAGQQAKKNPNLNLDEAQEHVSSRKNRKSNPKPTIPTDEITRSRHEDELTVASQGDLAACSTETPPEGRRAAALKLEWIDSDYFSMMSLPAYLLISPHTLFPYFPATLTLHDYLITSILDIEVSLSVIYATLLVALSTPVRPHTSYFSAFLEYDKRVVIH